MSVPSGEMVIYGINPISVLIEHAPSRIVRILALPKGQGREQLVERAREAGVEVGVTRERQLNHYVPDGQHQGIMAFVRSKEFSDWRTLCDPNASRLLVALDQVTDPRNFGAILRSAEAFGAAGVLITSNRCARPGPVVAKTSVGASELIPIAMETNLARALDVAKSAGFQIIGADMNGQPTVTLDWTQPTVLVIGAEGKGLRAKTTGCCDAIASISMMGKTESLNASVAASILLYEATRGGVVSSLG